MKKIVLWICICVVLFAKDNFTNALINETSPYLQQHAHNPVHWYPWGKEALEKARREHKLIFLSIGYSTCHWCHVMEEESFTDTEVAKLLNDHFVSIKVDREEYPQIDKKYQRIFAALRKGRGGWPLSVFMTPDMQVIDIRTYIPKEEGYGSEGMLKLLPSLFALFENPSALQKRLDANRIKILAYDQSPKQISILQDDLAKHLLEKIKASYDPQNGGFATHPKFPEASKLSLLLTLYRLYGNEEAYRMARVTLTRMAQRGIYDQMGGGFFRYSVDEAWQVPHFEKMLYTNAQMISVYVDAYLLSGDPLYRRVVAETIGAMRRHYMAEGLFVSASDADSDGEEGGYYLYSYEEIKRALLQKGWQRDETEAALGYLGIEEDGNIDGELSLAHISSADTAKPKPKKVEALKEYLLQLRKERSYPFVDTKINTAWNAMMIKVLFDASRIDRRYLTQAKQTLENLWQQMRKAGKLYHHKLPKRALQREALLEDYAYLIKALTTGYMRTYAPVYLERATILAEEARCKFYKGGKWYLSDDGLGIVADFDDRYYTAALSVLFDGMLDLASLREDLALYHFIKAQIDHARNLLASDHVEAAQLAYEALRIRHGDVIIHAPKEKLRRAQPSLVRLRYPFVLSKVQATNLYLACRIGSCFAQAKEIETLIALLAKQTAARPEKTKGKIWQKQ